MEIGNMTLMSLMSGVTTGIRREPPVSSGSTKVNPHSAEKNPGLSRTNQSSEQPASVTYTPVDETNSKAQSDSKIYNEKGEINHSTESKNTHQDDNIKEIKDESTNKEALGELRLTESEQKQVQELKQRDIEVKTHEAAHLAAAGQYATGGASFEYKRGPDGKNYAVGGEVGIDTSPIPNNPQATIQKARQIRAAAQAPAQPSSQDRQVAASAAKMEIDARAELLEQTQEQKQSLEEKQQSDVIKNNSDPATGSESNAIASEKNNNEASNNNVRKKASQEFSNIANLSRTENVLVDLVA